MIQWWLVILGLGNLWWLGDPLGNPSPYTGAHLESNGAVVPSKDLLCRKFKHFLRAKGKVVSTCFNHQSGIFASHSFNGQAKAITEPSISKVHQSALQLGVKTRGFSPDGRPKYIAGLCMVIPPYPNHMVSSFNGLVWGKILTGNHWFSH